VDVEDTIEADGSNALCKACLLGEAGIVSLLLKYKANVNSSSLMGNSPLHYACWDRKAEVVHLLLAAGADINRKNVDGYPPLLAAAFHGQAQIVALLVDSGADVGAIDGRGVTILHIAAEKNHEAVVDLVLSMINSQGTSADKKKSAAAAALLFATDVLGRRPLDACLVNPESQKIQERIAAAMMELQPPSESAASPPSHVGEAERRGHAAEAELEVPSPIPVPVPVPTPSPPSPTAAKESGLAETIRVKKEAQQQREAEALREKEKKEKKEKEKEEKEAQQQREAEALREKEKEANAKAKAKAEELKRKEEAAQAAKEAKEQAEAQALAMAQAQLHAQVQARLEERAKAEAEAEAFRAQLRREDEALASSLEIEPQLGTGTVLFLQALFRLHGRTKFRQMAYCFYSWRRSASSAWDCEWRGKYSSDAILMDLLRTGAKPSPAPSPVASPAPKQRLPQPFSATPASASASAIGEGCLAPHPEADFEAEGEGEAEPEFYPEGMYVGVADARSEVDTASVFSYRATMDPDHAAWGGDGNEDEEVSREQQRAPSPLSRRQFLALELVQSNEPLLQAIFSTYAHDTRQQALFASVGAGEGKAGSNLSKARIVSEDGFWRLLREWGVSPEMVGKAKLHEMLLKCVAPQPHHAAQGVAEPRSPPPPPPMTAASAPSSSSSASSTTPPRVVKRCSASFTPPPSSRGAGQVVSPLSATLGLTPPPSPSSGPGASGSKTVAPHLKSMPTTINASATTANLGASRSNPTLFSFRAFVHVRFCRSPLEFAASFPHTLTPPSLLSPPSPLLQLLYLITMEPPSSPIKIQASAHYSPAECSERLRRIFLRMDTSSGRDRIFKKSGGKVLPSFVL
jgi:hypothetical protein